jgi:hypothetical protein
MRARQRKKNDEAREGQDSDNEDAAFWASCATAENGLADGMRGEKMVLDHGSAIGNSIEKGLAPIPCSVEADCPP